MKRPSDLPVSSNESSESSKKKSKNFDRGSNWVLWIGVIGVFFLLGWIAISQSGRADGEKKRGDTLQQGIDALRDRSEEDRKFFEIVRQLLIAQGAEQKAALLDQLRGFQFTEPTTTTTTTVPKKAQKSTTTTTTPNSSPTTAPRPSPSTTTTTAPPSPPPSRPCVTTPVVNVCPPTASSNERKPS